MRGRWVLPLTASRRARSMEGFLKCLTEPGDLDKLWRAYLPETTPWQSSGYDVGNNVVAHDAKPHGGREYHSDERLGWTCANWLTKVPIRTLFLDSGKEGKS